MSLFFKVAFRRFQLRFFRTRSIGWIAFWAYLGLLAVSSIFSDRGLLTAYRLWSQSEKVERKNVIMEAQVLDLRQEVHDFKTNPRTLERYAREELHLVGQNEIHYIFQ